MTGTVHKLAELRYPDVARITSGGRPSVALIPLGSTEAHGPHLPLATDSLISEGQANGAATKLAAAGVDVVLFPTQHYVVTDWAASFPGTVTVSADVVEPMLLQICLGAKGMGFDRVCITNAHLDPGNIQSLRSVAKKYEASTGEALVFPDKTRRKMAAKLTAEFQSGSCHAGQYETSLVLALAPDLVDMDAAKALPEFTVALHEHIARGAADFAACGVDDAYCGAPAQATAEEGRETLEVLADMVVDAVQASLAGGEASKD